MAGRGFPVVSRVLQTRQQQISFLVSFALACLITLGLEQLAEHAIESSGPENPGLAPSIFEISGIYQRIVAAGPRKPKPTFTVVVPIEAAKGDPNLFNVCRQRGFLADLIRATAAFSPSVIVIDKYFSTECGKTDAGTRALQNALREVTRRVPVVVGRTVDEKAAQTRGDHAQPTPPPLLPAPEIGKKFGVREGLIELQADTRRLPLGWTVRGDMGKGELWATLPLTAAEAYDSRLQKKYPFLAQLIADHEEPYISFLNLRDLEKYSVYSTLDILCAGKKKYLNRTCPDRPREDLEYLRGRIVVIGEVNEDMDSHYSVIGYVPGIILHANYIEALLDQRYFKPVGWWMNYGVGFLIYFAFHFVLVKHHHAMQEARRRDVVLVFLKALGWSMVVVAGAIVLLYLTVIHTGWYVNPVTMGLVAFVIKLGELIFAAVPRGAGEAK
ncbi:MAG TPA: CHASE2 domain-containing protein [Candidatus Binatia bacterium]